MLLHRVYNMLPKTAQAPQGRQQHLVLRYRGLSDGRHRQVLLGPRQPHQDSASPRTGTVRGHLRQRQPANNVVYSMFFMSSILWSFRSYDIYFEN